MATNNVYESRLHVPVTAPKAVSAGDAVATGKIAGVAIDDTASGADVVLALDGVWDLSKLTSESLAGGLDVYVDADGTGNIVASTSATNTYIGVTLSAVNSAATTVPVIVGYPKKA